MSHDQTRVNAMVRTYKSNLLYDHTNGISNYEHEARLDRIVNFSFDKRYLQSRFKQNNMEFYSAISNAENELLEWRYEAILDKEFNTSIVLVLKTANEPMKQVDTSFFDELFLDDVKVRLDLDNLTDYEFFGY